MMKQTKKSAVYLGRTLLSAENCGIVIPPKASVTEKKAAKEFQLHMEKCTGEKLKITTEKSCGKEVKIYIGHAAEKAGFSPDYTALGDEGIFLENNGKAMALTGGKRGVLYAVFTFLEDYVGFRWFSADCIKVPSAEKIKVCKFRKQYVPPFEYRATDYPVSRPLEFAVRNRYNGHCLANKEEWGGNIRYCGGFVHTFASLVPPSKYAESHPEYYSLIDGKRETGWSQLCLTNPEVLEIAWNSVKEWIQKNPDAKIVSVSQNDNQRYCQCEKCTALAEKEGSQCGPLLHFVNEIARRAAKEFPDVIIDTLAYQYTRKPPKYVVPEPNVDIRLCSIECCFTHSLQDCPTPQNESFRTDIENWSKICQRLYIWDYVINYANCLAPLPNIRVLQPNIRFFRDHGVTGIYEEAAYFCPGTEMAPLRSYLMAKLLWDPEIDVNQAITEFTDGYFGEAGPYIREYINLIHDEVCDKNHKHLGIYVNPGDYLSNEILQKAFALFEQALKAVKKSKVRTLRVKTERLAVLYSILAAKDGFPLKREVPPEHREYANMFREDAKNAGLTHIYESSTPELIPWLDRKD